MLRRYLLLQLRASAIVVEASVFLLCLRWAGPDAEAAFFPVVRNAGVHDVARVDSGRAVCWTLAFDKARPAEIVDASYTLRAGAIIYPFQRSWRVDDLGREDASVRSRPVGDRQSTRRCSEVPAELADRPFQVTGFLEYRTAWTGALWTVRMPTPEVAVP